MSSGRRIVLGEDDFEDPAPGHSPEPSGMPSTASSAPVPGAPPAAGLPPVTHSAPLRMDPGPGMQAMPKYASGGQVNLLHDPRTSLLIAAGIGILLAWGITEIFGINNIVAHSKTGSDAVAGLWVAVIGLVFGGTLLSFDRAVAGAWDAAGRRFATASVPMLLVGFVAGFAANALYLQIVQSVLNAAIRSGNIPSENDVRFYLARLLGWAIFGLGVGVTLGLLEKSRRRAVNGAIGGALGGAAGGLVFQFAAANLHSSDTMSRLLGLIGVGALIALAMRVVEAARREAWIKVLAGGMSGKEFILYHNITRIGSSPDCEIFLLKDPAVAKLHAQVEDQASRRVLTAAPGAPVFVNGSQISVHGLRHGDQIQIGNTVIGYSERAVPAAQPGAFPGVR